MNRELFTNWLQVNGYEEGTINSYTNNYIPSIENHTGSSIYGVTDIQQLQVVLTNFQNNSPNLADATISNYVSALNRYIDFISE